MKKFTRDEKIIAKNINKKYKWMARDKSGGLYIYMNKPTKKGSSSNWLANDFLYINIKNFIDIKDMFKNIKWEDDEPTRIRDIYDPQILDDIERGYLKAVLKPFHEKVVYVEKCRGYITDKEYLFISFQCGSFTFPDFGSGKMYSRMELSKRYTLDELGITYTEGK